MAHDNDKTRVQVSIRLECGCWVANTLCSSRAPEEIEKTLRLAADVLPHHFDKTVIAHKCELVDEDNPNGEARGN